MAPHDRLLFLHGAGGFDEDRSLADGIAAALGATLDYPRLPDDDMTCAAWSSAVRERLTEWPSGTSLIAHSFGASILLHVLSEIGLDHGNSPVALLALPNWGPRGWDIAEYAFRGPEPSRRLVLHHCRDDAVVPFDHLALNVALLPSAGVRVHPSGGHQFEGLVGAIAADVN
ncbi:alpha/beta hydrolase [Gordonia sp. CPCC 206044]|uniref:alpha/beta hydrolase n=1 Tax=Gordonia sp. CPCC 206044 TaxID=3140793 RepID=UPI003AF40290